MAFSSLFVVWRGFFWFLGFEGLSEVIDVAEELAWLFGDFRSLEDAAYPELTLIYGLEVRGILDGVHVDLTCHLWLGIRSRGTHLNYPTIR